MSDIDRIRRKVKQARKPFEFTAIMGRADGTVKKDSESVYVTLLNGDVITVYNSKLPLTPFRRVKVGEIDGLLQCVKYDPVYNRQPLPEIPNHKDTHQWYAHDPLEIAQQQIMPLLPRSYSGLTVRVFGGEYVCNAVTCVIDNTDFDMTAEVPVSGAEWVSVFVDENKTITYQHSSNKASRAILLPSDIVISYGYRKLLFAVKLYYGQSIIIQTRTDTDLFDPRFTGISSSGISSFVDWDDVQNKPTVFIPDISYTDDLYPRKWLKFADPTADDNEDAGYNPPDIWINQSTNDVFVCVFSDMYDAEWMKVNSGSGGAYRFEVHGRLAVTNNATSAILLDTDTTIPQWALYLESLGTSGSTILDVLLYRNEGLCFDENPTSIFGDCLGELPEIQYNDLDHVAYFTPIVTDFLAGDVLVLVIEQIAPTASDLIFQPVGQSGGGSSFSLTVSDGETDVDGVGKITFEGAGMIDAGGGEVKIAVPIPAVVMFPFLYSAKVGTYTRYEELFYNSSNHNGDYLEFSTYLPKGTYTFVVVYSKYNNGGLLDITLDGESVVSGIDCYGATIHDLQSVTTGIVVTTSGFAKLIRVAVNGKNPSSSAYYSYWTSMKIVQTG